MTLPVRGTDPPLRLLAAFHQIYPDLSATHIVQTPGRDMWVAASVGHTDSFTLHVPDLAAHTSFSRRTAKLCRTLLNRPLPRWSRYPAAVVLVLNDVGLEIDGFDAVVIGEESPGPRYEYALGMTCATLIHSVCNRFFTAGSLLDIVEKARREYVEVEK